MSISDYNTDPLLNTSIGGKDIAENCSPANMNNAVREMMSDLAYFYIDNTAAIREVQDDADRAITVPVGELGSSVPAVATRKNKVLLFDNVGEAGVSGFSAIYSGTTAVIADSRTILSAMTGMADGQTVALSEAGREGLFTYRTGNYSTHVTADPRQGIYVAPNSAPTGSSGAWVRQRDSLTVSASWFGAATTATAAVNTDSLRAASDMIEFQGGGRLIVAPGEYSVGKQSALAGSTGLGYSYNGTNGIIEITNCTLPVEIIGWGVRLKNVAGYKYGSFNPSTGLVYNPTLPFVDNDYAAWLVRGQIYVTGNAAVSIKGFELHGNVTALSLGGQWGDSGWQVKGSGIYADANASLEIDSVYSHHHPLDGMMIGYTGLLTTNTRQPLTMRGCRMENNGRQGLSWVGGNGLTAINCSFNTTGRNGVVSSSPGAGVDIEAESSIIRNGTFIDCEFVDNAGPGMIAYSGDSADVSFFRCSFIGTTSRSAQPNKPGFKFHDCTFVGMLETIYESADSERACQFYNCRFSSALSLSPTGSVYGSTLISGAGNLQNVLFDNCLLDAQGSVTIAQGMLTAIIRDCTATQAGVGASLWRGKFYGNNVITSGGGNSIFGAVNYGHLVLDGVAQKTVFPAQIETPVMSGNLATGFILQNAAATKGFRLIESGGEVYLQAGDLAGGAATLNLTSVLGGVLTVWAQSGSFRASSFKDAGNLQVVGSRYSAIANAVNAAGVPTQAEFNALVGVVNNILSALRASTGHGLIAG